MKKGAQCRAGMSLSHAWSHSSNVLAVVVTPRQGREGTDKNDQGHRAASIWRVYQLRASTGKEATQGGI